MLNVQSAFSFVNPAASAMRTVLCELANGVVVQNNVRTCAERRAIELLKQRALRKGVSAHNVWRFLYRALNFCVITRRQKNEQLSISLPCVCCRRQLDRLGVRWSACDREGNFVTDDNAPPALKTSRQRIFMK